jgi:hypothetical protein
MNRSIATMLGIVAAAAAAAIAMASGKAFADDITTETKPFVSTKSRAEIQSDLLKNSRLASEESSEWTTQYNQGHQVKSSYTSQQARADYAASREEVMQLNGEDSGSSYFSIRKVNPTQTMGGPAR